MVTYNGITFSTVYDAVDDLGMDNTGGTDIVQTLEANYQSDTLIKFPPGEYLISSGFQDVTNTVTNWGVMGTGKRRRDVKWVVDDPANTNLNSSRFLNLQSGKSNHLFRNFAFDYGTNGDRFASMRIDVTDGLVMQDIEWLGKIPTDNDTSIHSSGDRILDWAATDSAGVATTRRLIAGVDTPAKSATYPDGIGFVINHGGHAGEAVLEDWWVRDLNSSANRNGTSAGGVMTIRGGRYTNIDNTGIRTSNGSHSSKDTTVHHAIVIQNNLFDTANPINVDNSGENYYGAIFRKVKLKITYDGGQTVIDIPDWGDHGSVEFHDCLVHNDIPRWTLRAESVGFEPDDITITGGQWVETGSGNGMYADARDGSTISDACVDVSSIDSTFSLTNVDTSGCNTDWPIRDFGAIGRTEDGVAETHQGIAKCR